MNTCSSPRLKLSSKRFTVAHVKRYSLRPSSRFQARSKDQEIKRYEVELHPQSSLASVDVNGIVQELCESRGGRPGLSVLTSLLVSVDVKLYRTMLRHWSQLVPNMSTNI